MSVSTKATSNKDKFIGKEIYYLKSSNAELLKSVVVDSQNNSFDLPFYISTDHKELELSKRSRKDNTVEFSLLFHEEFNYKLNEIYNFTVENVEKRVRDDMEKFSLKIKNSNNDEFSLPIRKLDALNIKPNDKIKCLVDKIYPKKIFFSLIPEVKNSFINDFEYTFEIVDKVLLKNRKDLASFIVQHGGNYFDTIGPAWQFTYTFKELRGRVNNENKVIQSFTNLSHPLFEKGKVYTFSFLENVQNNSDYILVKGVDDCVYSIKKPFVFQQGNFVTGTPIKLVYRDISENTGAIKVKYFVQFEEIIQDFRAIKRITFDTFRKEINEDGQSPPRFVSSRTLRLNLRCGKSSTMVCRTSE